MMFLIRMNTGSVSGVIHLTIDGEAVEIDGIDVEVFLGHNFNTNMKLRDGTFNLNRGAYGYHRLNFSLDPSTWDNTGENLEIEITFFNTNPRATTLYGIAVIITTGENSSIEIVATAVHENSNHLHYIRSELLPLNSTDMPISLHIPSP